MKSPLAMIGPSILNADLSSLFDECQKMISSKADYLHLDVMDGHFVPNLTFGHPVVESLRRKIPKGYFDCHMMVANPEKWVESMSKAGASQYTFHLEASDDVSSLIRHIQEAGMDVGIAIKPGTNVEQVLPYVEDSNMVLIMTVEPGFGGQAFQEKMLQKMKYLRDRYPKLNIGVDGGVGLGNAEQCAQAGANMLVSGSAVIKSADPKEAMESMRSSLKKYFEWQKPTFES